MIKSNIITVLGVSFLATCSVSHAQPDTLGYVDSVTKYYGFYDSVRVKGWACLSGKNESIDVHAFVDDYAGNYGYYVGSATANLSSGQDVADACSNSFYYHRFDMYLPFDVTRFGGQSVWVHGINNYPGGTNSPITNSGSLVIPLPDTIPYPVVTGLEVETIQEPGSFVYADHKLSWNAVSGATSYQVFVSDYEGNITEWGGITGTEFTHEHVDIYPFYYHRYMVRACGAGGCGIYGSSAFE